MAFNLGSVFIQIGANNAPLQRDLKDTDRIMKNFRSTVVSIGGPLAGAFAIGSIVQNAVTTITSFEQAVADLSSITGKSASQMDKLVESAIQIGAVSSFSASQVVGLQTELAKLGFSESEILDSTKAIGDFSVAVGTDAASAAALGGAALRSFGLDASEAEGVMNTLAVATVKSALDFSKLQTALPYVGTAAQQMGLSIEKTTAILGLLSDRGVRAETAGTSLRDILLDSAKSGLTFEESLSRVANSQDKLKTATELFGKSSAGAAVIIAENGSQLNRLEASITNADGSLKKMTDERLNTVNGRLEIAKSSWEAFVLSVDKGDGIFSRAAKKTLDIFADLLDDLKVLNDEGVAGLEKKGRSKLRADIKRDQIAALPKVGGTMGTAFGKTFQDELKGAETVLANLKEKLKNTTVGTAEFKQVQEDVASSQARVNSLTNQYLGIVDNNVKKLNTLGETGKKAQAKIPKETTFKIIGQLDIPTDTILGDVDKELAKIRALGNVGLDTNVAQSEINLLTDVIRDLITEGVDPADAKIIQFSERIKFLKGTADAGILTNLSTELQKLQVLGDLGLTSDVTSQKIGLITSAMTDLIDQGIDPASTQVQNLKKELDALKAPNLGDILKGIDTKLQETSLKVNLGFDINKIDEDIKVLEEGILSLSASGFAGSEAFGQLLTKLQELRNEAANGAKELAEVTVGLDSVFLGVAESLGQLFSGDGGASAFFGNIISIVGQFAQDLGKQMISVGAAGIALKTTFSNPAAAIAAGAALVALGGVVKAKFSKGIPSLDVGTNLVTKDGLAMIHRGEEIRPASVVSGGYKEQRNTSSGRSTTMIRGNDLYIINSTTDILRKRTA